MTRRKKRILSALLIAISIMVFGYFGLRWYVGYVLLTAPVYQGPVSGHFNGERFQNMEPIVREHGFRRYMWWRWTTPRAEWREFTPVEPGPPPPERVGDGEIRVTFVNHATFLVQMDGVNILTDPIWSERASPFSWAGPKRHRPPGIRFEDLPPIDAVVISHNHYDHLDLPTLRRLAELHQPAIYMGLGNSLLLAEEKIPGGIDMDWGDTAELDGGVTVIFVPAQHWSSRGLGDRSGTLWGGYVISGPSGTVYFAGDTGDGVFFDQVAKDHAPIDVAILPIGAYLPTWFMGPVHMSPQEAVEVHQRLGAGVTIGSHFGTFDLAGDGERQPVIELEKARDAAGLSSDEIRVLEFGEALMITTP